MEVPLKALSTGPVEPIRAKAMQKSRDRAQAISSAKVAGTTIVRNMTIGATTGIIDAQ